MQKLIRNGKVAVIYSCDWGSGWGSWENDGREFDGELATLLLNGEDSVPYLRINYGYDIFFPALDVKWIEEGTEFWIHEYDGLEMILTKEQMTWRTA